MANKIKNTILTISTAIASVMIFSLSAFAEGTAPDTAILKDIKNIEGILNLILTVVTTGVGIAAIGSIAFAGVLYMTSGNNSSQVQKAKTMIANTVYGIIAYALMWSFLQWIIPGGIF